MSWVVQVKYFHIINEMFSCFVFKLDARYIINYENLNVYQSGLYNWALKFDIYSKTLGFSWEKDFMLVCFWDMIPSSLCTLRVWLWLSNKPPRERGGERKKLTSLEPLPRWLSFECYLIHGHQRLKPATDLWCNRRMSSLTWRIRNAGSRLQLPNLTLSLDFQLKCSWMYTLKTNTGIHPKK